MNQYIKPCEVKLTPTNIYKTCKSLYKDTALLESFGHDIDTSRFSIIGVIAKEKVITKGDTCFLLNQDGNTIKEVDWIDILDSWVKLDNNSSTNMQLGTIGYIGYENKEQFESLKVKIDNDNNLADTYLVNYSLMLWFDKKIDKAFWVYDDSINELYIEKIEVKLQAGSQCPPSPFMVLGDSKADFTEKEYHQIIDKTKEYIRNGDIFQANITMRYHVKCGGDPFHLYQELCIQTPNPFMAYLDFEHPIISTSPERFFKVSDKNISTNPIKGTLKFTPKNEQEMYQQLSSSKKDRAENTMIVDLMRNDLGRICQHDSIKTPELCKIKKFNNLFHFESIIEGKLNDGIKISDVLAATFPGGSITGAPKIRAMEVIEELEDKKRKVYCGTIGFFGQQGYVDTSIAIRTMYVVDGVLYYHAGGGIVIDSQSNLELAELKAKLSKIDSSLNKFNVLNSYRKRLDSIDQVLLQLFGERFQIIREVSDIKSRFDIPILQKRRVEEMIVKRTQVGKEKHDLCGDFVKELFHLIINHSMEAESNSISNLHMEKA